MVLLAAGCSAGQSPADLGTARAPRASVTPYTLPEPVHGPAMDVDPVGVDGAIAAATYFMQLYPYVFATGDVTALQALSHPDCAFCTKVSKDAAALHEEFGNHMEGLETRFVSASGSEVDPGREFTVEAEVEQQGFSVVDPVGNVLESDDAIVVTPMTFTVVHEDGRWLIREAQAHHD